MFHYPICFIIRPTVFWHIRLEIMPEWNTVKQFPYSPICSNIKGYQPNFMTSVSDTWIRLFYWRKDKKVPIDNIVFRKKQKPLNKYSKVFQGKNYCLHISFCIHIVSDIIELLLNVNWFKLLYLMLWIKTVM